MNVNYEAADNASHLRPGQCTTLHVIVRLGCAGQKYLSSTQILYNPQVTLQRRSLPASRTVGDHDTDSAPGGGPSSPSPFIHSFLSDLPGEARGRAPAATRRKEKSTDSLAAAKVAW